jgi:uncharacterized protein (TIGR02145 family)
LCFRIKNVKVEKIMIRYYILTTLILCSVYLQGQNLQMTFTASGTASKVDSVTATNLRTNKSVQLPGSETLVLSSTSTLVSSFPEHEKPGIIFPNPCLGKATAVFYVGKSQSVVAEVYNLTGQCIARSFVPVISGEQAFSLSFSKTGVFLVRLSGEFETINLKILCTETTEPGDLILHTGSVQGYGLAPLIKKATVYTLGYESGDILLYMCKSGKYKTVVTDSPEYSKKYQVEFSLCEDRDGKNYPVVKIGNQTWMAENLAWLPSVTPASKGSDSLKHYYVYAFEDSTLNLAKKSSHYSREGVLYNWPAALNSEGGKISVTGKIRGACPSGWHIPDDDEWKILEKTLGMSQRIADSLFLRNSENTGAKLKSSLHWLNEGNGSNFSGFTALPSGYRNKHGKFFHSEGYSLFWTATTSGDIVWYRGLNGLSNGIYRCATMKGHALSVRCIRD